MERRATKTDAASAVDEERQELVRKIAAEKSAKRSFYLIPPFLVHNRKQLLVPSTVVNVIVFAIMRYADAKFTNVVVPHGQVSLQFAFTYENAMTMVHSWNHSERQWLNFQLYFGKKPWTLCATFD